MLDSVVDAVEDFVDFVVDNIFAIIVALVVVAGGVFFFFWPSLFSSDDGEGDTFELTTNETTIGVGQSKYVVSEMAYTRVIDSMIWESSDESIVAVSYVEGCDNNFVALKGVSPGNAIVKAISGDCFREVAVTVTSESPDNVLKVYNQNSESKRYAILDGEGFKDGVLSLAFNYNGIPVISLCGYTQEMLSKSASNIGNACVDFKKIDITLRDTTVGTTISYETWNSSDSNKYVSPIIAPNDHLTVDHQYSVDYHITLKDDTDYHITGTITYNSNDGKLDGTNLFSRAYTWKYDDKTFSFKLNFPFGVYSRYHNQNGDYVIGNGTYSRNSGVADYDETYFCRSNMITQAIEDAVSEQYKKAYGENVSLKDQKYADYILAFVQICWTYEYDYNQYVTTTKTDNVDYWAFPMETIYSGIGDCEDTSILCATFFHDAGYKAGVYSIPSHAMVAVHIDSYVTPIVTKNHEIMCYIQTKTDTSFYGCESTAEWSCPAGVAASSLIRDEHGNKFPLNKVYLYVI